MNIKIKFILVAISLSVMSVAYGGSGTNSTSMRPGDWATIESFGKNFFTSGCEFGDTDDLKDKQKDDIFYYPISKIHPGQTTFSELNTEEKMEKIKKAHKSYAEQNNGKFTEYDDGKAVYPLNKDKAFPVYNTPWGLILINGHHRTMASWRLGATTIPVIIINDMRNLRADQLDEFKTKIDPINAKGKRVRMPCTIEELDQAKNDDPNRYFVKISAFFGDEKPSGTKHPLWIPMGQYYGRQEFVIAILLNKSGLIYNNEDRDKIPDSFIEDARRLLKEHESKDREKATALCVIKDKTSYKKALFIDNTTCPEAYKMWLKN